MFLIRPFALDFLKALSPLFEIVIFTAGTKDVREESLNYSTPMTSWTNWTEKDTSTIVSIGITLLT